MPRVGVLSYQGDFQRHSDVLTNLGLTVVPVRAPEHLEGLSGLVIPGGESTTIGMLMERFGLLDATRQAGRKGMPLFGTCAGAILLAEEIEKSDQPRLGLMDIRVTRNAYGRQIESFEAELDLLVDDSRDPAAHRPLTGVFIRAPIITHMGAGVETLAEFEGTPVLVSQGTYLAATFHPELTGDDRVHRLFARRVIEFADR
ncbi:MAG: pyridoxal 5'-phosphate synthase glutaminase subunit PdxT [Spirochaetaceae bacterium]